MAKINVKYLGNFSIITKRMQEEITISENEDIRSLLSKLSQKYGRVFQRALDNPMTIIWVNDSSCDKDTVLHHGDKLTLRDRDKLIIATLAGGG